MSLHWFSNVVAAKESNNIVIGPALSTNATWKVRELDVETIFIAEGNIDAATSPSIKYIMSNSVYELIRKNSNRFSGIRIIAEISIAFCGPILSIINPQGIDDDT